MSIAARGVLMLVISQSLAGCLAIDLAGEAVRSQQQEFEMMLAPGMTPGMLAKKQSVAVSVQAAGQGQMTIAGGFGATNTAVLSDLIMTEFLRLGYQAKGLDKSVSDTDSARFEELTNQGFDIVLVGNMNMALTKSTFGAITGAMGIDQGVTSFTLKGLDLPSGKLLFVMSGKYGVAQKPEKVAADVATMYKGKLTGQQATK